MIWLALAMVLGSAQAAETSGAPAPGEPVAMWGRLRAAYAGHLARPGEPLGRQAAAFLRTSSVALEAGDLQARLGDDVFAAYDASARAIRLDRQGLKDVWLSLQSAELHPERLEPFVERTAGAVVHEIRHAIDHQALGEAPMFSENELAAYADQAIFLQEKLEADPGYRRLNVMDQAVGERLGEPRSSDRAWWRRALPRVSSARLLTAVEEARARLPKLMTSQESNDWFLVRAWAGGFDRFKADLAALGYLPALSLLDPPAGASERSRSALEHLWRQLAVVRSSKLPPQERARRAAPIEAQLDAAERLAAFWGDPARRERAREYIAGVLGRYRRAPAAAIDLEEKHADDQSR